MKSSTDKRGMELIWMVDDFGDNLPWGHPTSSMFISDVILALAVGLTVS
jgi:hypothetical protein